MKSPTVALVGNPNIGKTTLFNMLTGAHQKVGNWPGVTVEQKSGYFDLLGPEVAGAESARINVIDLPGIYMLDASEKGVDEQIARNYVESGNADIIVNVVDASNLRRNLQLTEQLLELSKPVIVALNMCDVARSRGIQVDADALAERLGCPVIAMSASHNRGVKTLVKAIASMLGEQGGLENFRPPGSRAERSTSDAGITDESVVNRYKRIDTLMNGVVVMESRATSKTDVIDSFVLNRCLGIPVFLAVMYLLFTFSVNVGGAFIDFFDITFAAFFVDGTRWLLTEAGAPDLLTTLLADGVGGGITLVATFVPIIAFLYIGLAFLEDSGYMARAAFVIDRVMSGVGLPGNAFVPLIVGFGCNVPSVMASRTLSRENDRLLTIAMAPFMSCGARLTVYVLFAAAFFKESGQNVVFLLYLMGIVVAVATGFIFRRQIFPDVSAASIQEMPAYHLPVLRNVLTSTWFRLQGFIRSAGKAIVAVVVVLSFLNSLGTDGSFGNEDSSRSVLSAVGKSITPLFKPIGVDEDNWPATVGLFTGMFAKEAIVGTLDALYDQSEVESGSDSEALNIPEAFALALDSVAEAFANMGSLLVDPLGIRIGDVSDETQIVEEHELGSGTLANMARMFATPVAAFAYLSFVLLYAPCVAVVGAMVREAGHRWAALVFGWSTLVAYYVASCIYQFSQIGSQTMQSLLWIVLATVTMAAVISQLKRIAGVRVAGDIKLVDVTQ